MNSRVLAESVVDLDLACVSNRRSGARRGARASNSSFVGLSAENKCAFMSPQAERRRESSYRRGMAAHRRGIGQCCRAGRIVKAARTECALLHTQDADAPVPVRPKEVPACLLRCSVLLEYPQAISYRFPHKAARASPDGSTSPPSLAAVSPRTREIRRVRLRVHPIPGKVVATPCRRMQHRTEQSICTPTR